VCKPFNDLYGRPDHATAKRSFRNGANPAGAWPVSQDH
jgi:hypothetical protein